MENRVYLAGDLGGTKTLLRLFRNDSVKGDQVLFERNYASRDFSDFASLVSAFLSAAPPVEVRAITKACFAVAGPVNDGGQAQTSTITNLEWVLDSDELARTLKLARVTLINDFVAVGYGIAAVPREQLAILREGSADVTAPCMVLGAGTGLGVCQIVRRGGDRVDVLSSEGGHVDFAPNSELEIEYLRYMWRKYEHVSYDRILSGSGLVSLLAFLAERGGRKDDPVIQDLLDERLGPERISNCYDKDPLARVAVDLFVRLYGAQAGNLALINLAFGGVFLAGGIAPKMLARISDGAFMEAFCNKGRMRPLLERMPVSVVMDTQVGLRGAQVVAAST